MMLKPRLISRSCFGAVLLSLALPFFTISCPGEKISVSGVDLLVGTDLGGERSRLSQPERLQPQPAIIVVGLLAGCGLMLTLPAQAMLRTAATISALAVLILFGYLVYSQAQVRLQTGGIASFEPEVGFWLAILGLVGSTLAPMLSRFAATAPAAPPGSAQEPLPPATS